MKPPMLALAVLATFTATLAAQSTTRVSVGSTGIHGGNDAEPYPFISADGRFVVFTARDGLIPGDTDGQPDAVVHDRQSGQLSMLVTLPGGVQPDSWQYVMGASSDARFVTIQTPASNLVPGDTLGFTDAYLCDRATGQIVRASLTSSGAEPNNDIGDSCVSDDGRFVAFTTSASNFVPGDINDDPDVYLRDVQAGTTICISTTPGGVPASGFYPKLSRDGRYISFGSNATDIVSPDANGMAADVFVYDRITGVNTRVSRSSAGIQASMACNMPMISGDGRFVVFDGYANNLVAGDTNGDSDIFRHELATGITLRVSLTNNGSQSNGRSAIACISDDGSQIAFRATATNLVPNDTNNGEDLFLRDVALSTTERVNVDSSGNQALANVPLAGVYYPGISSNGRYVMFVTPYENLVPGDDNRALDLLLRDRLSNAPPVTTYCTAKVNSQGCTPTIGASGEPRSFTSDAFFVTATNVLNKKPGLLIWSTTSAATPFLGGTLCLGIPVNRTPPQSSGGSPVGANCTGVYSFHFSQAYMAAHGLVPATVVFTQFWSRDPGFVPPNNSGLTAGLKFTVAL